MTVRTCVLVAMVLISPSAAAAQPAQLPAADSLLVIDSSDVSDSELAQLYGTAAQLPGSDNWRFLSGQSARSLNDILAAEYNLTATNAIRYPETRNIVEDMIRGVNASVISPDSFVVPALLRVPRVPSLPDDDARRDLAQVPLDSGTYAVVALSDLRGGTFSERFRPIERRKASVLVFELSLEFTTTMRAQGSLALQVYNRSARPHISLTPLAPTHCGERVSQHGPTPITPISPGLKQRIAAIDSHVSGYLYVLDFDVDDHHECSHGRKVLEVVKELLDAYGASMLVDSVRAIELNYFAHPLAEVKTLNTILDTVIDHSLACQYRRLFAESFDLALPSCDAALTELAFPTGPAAQHTVAAVPGFFLWLLYEYVLDGDSGASAVSSSFFALTNGFDVATSESPAQWPALVTAVLNPDRFPPALVDQTSSQQPIRRFFERRREFGTFLVGALLNDGSSFGMTSSPAYPDGVTALAQGEGYGTTNPATMRVTTPISPDDRGTSFATPAIAVQLFLARALWRSEHRSAAEEDADPVSVMEAKRRLVLSADVVPQLVGKVASAGVPVFERLVAPVQPGTDLVVTGAGAIRSGSVKEATVRFDGSTQYYPNHFSGIQARGPTVFVFDEQTKSWREAEDGNFYVRIVTDRGDEIFSEPQVFGSLFHLIARYR